MLPEGIMIMDKNLEKINYANPAAKRILLKKPRTNGGSVSSANSLENDVKAHF